MLKMSNGETLLGKTETDEFPDALSESQAELFVLINGMTLKNTVKIMQIYNTDTHEIDLSFTEWFPNSLESQCFINPDHIIGLITVSPEIFTRYESLLNEQKESKIVMVDTKKALFNGK